jgi:hypothetical protein
VTDRFPCTFTSRVDGVIRGGNTETERLPKYQESVSRERLLPIPENRNKGISVPFGEAPGLGLGAIAAPMRPLGAWSPRGSEALTQCVEFHSQVSPRRAPVMVEPPNNTTSPSLESYAAAASNRGEGADEELNVVQFPDPGDTFHTNSQVSFSAIGFLVTGSHPPNMISW